MTATSEAVSTAWRVRGSYFEGCNCEAICPCRSVGGEPGGPSTYGVCYGVLSWHIAEGSAGDVDLSGLDVVLALRYRDEVQPSTLWEVVLYVSEQASAEQQRWCADIFLGRAGGRVAELYGPAIGTVHEVVPARITLEHVAPRKRIDVVGYLTVEAEGAASDAGDVRCGIPGYDHPGTEMYADVLVSRHSKLRWEIRGGRKASFATEFAYTSTGGPTGPAPG